MYDADALLDDFDDSLNPEMDELEIGVDDELDVEEEDDVEDQLEIESDDEEEPDLLDEELLRMEPGETWSDDPVRMYLTQMGEIPLLTRQREIQLAQQIESTRLKFRTKLLECDYVLQHSVRTLKRVFDNELPFDRTVQVSESDNLEKRQIMGRFPYNLQSLEKIIRRNARDYKVATSRSHTREERSKAWKDLGRRRRRAVRMIEELGLRTQRIESMINTLEEFSRRVDELRRWIKEHKASGRPRHERMHWCAEYKNILQLTQESPTSLRNRVAAIKSIFA